MNKPESRLAIEAVLNVIGPCLPSLKNLDSSLAYNILQVAFTMIGNEVSPQVSILTLKIVKMRGNTNLRAEETTYVGIDVGKEKLDIAIPVSEKAYHTLYRGE